MNWLQAALPTIATALGGPLAGAAAGFVADKLGLSEKTIDAVKTAISGATPEQLVQMKQIDAELQKFFAGLDIDLEKIAAADRDSAREREAKTGDSATPRWLAFLITFGFFGVLGWLLVAGKPEEGGDALLVMLGSLGGAWSACVAYYFGSTKGSAEKTALLAKAGK
jgi:hypothetical protein